MTGGVGVPLQNTPHPAAMRGHPLPKVEGFVFLGVARGGT